MRGRLKAIARVARGRLTLSAGGFEAGPGLPRMALVGGERLLLKLTSAKRGARRQELRWQAKGVEVVQVIERETAARLRVTSELRNRRTAAVELDHVTLFESATLGLGEDPASVRILEQNAYLGRVRTPRQMFTGSDQLKALDGTEAAFVSHSHTVFYNPASKGAMLLGFETIDRWSPFFTGRMRGDAGRDANVMDNVDAAPAGATSAGRKVAQTARVPAFRRFAIECDGGGLQVQPNETVALGGFVVEAGGDPLALLDAHGARIQRRNGFAPAPKAFANWCSWYPYRLGVTQERVLATAKAAKRRGLDRLGLRFLQVDLGWEKDNIPTYFEPNERFSQGIKALASRLRLEGFELGLWVGVLCVADVHPIAQEHPEWLLRADGAKPKENYRWFWEPFSAMYALDVSHPGAQAWLRENFTRLARDGVRFFKWDFGGIVTTAGLRGRHDSRFVNTRARQAIQTAYRIAQDAMDGVAPGAQMIDCSGVDHGAAGVAGVSYGCMDTGNSGIGWDHLRSVYTAFACHFFRRHWALVQPSCLVVGLPGTLEEARMRATATYMGAGHVDIGDDLTTLPEDRWSVLLATLPPKETPARAVDLFEPIRTGQLGYLSLIKEKENKPKRGPHAPEPDGLSLGEPLGTNVWSSPMRADWDEWTLVAVFNWLPPEKEPSSGVNLGRRYRVELERLGLSRNATLWGYEFWSGQFLGELPRAARKPDAYRHPGDFTHPIQCSGPGWLDIGFHGPAVKLLVLRKPRPHPWPVGTSFHQSGGQELANVRWNPRTRTLSGELLRPKGESGFIAIAGLPDGENRRLAVTATSDVTAWRLTFSANELRSSGRAGRN